MVDLTQRGAGTKKQRAFHMNDETHARLAKAAELTNSTMSAVLDRLIWDDLRLPGDPDSVMDIALSTVQPDEPEQPLATGREAEIADRALNDPNSPDALNAKARDRLRKRGHFATRLDGSDQTERDPGLVSRPGNDGFDL